MTMTTADPENPMQRASDAHIIAKRLRSGKGGWRSVAGAPMTIEQARAAHERGELDMAQGVDETHVLQFAIPRHHREVGRRPWFWRREAA